MSQILDLDLAHLHRLPASHDTWQLAVVRMPTWVRDSETTAHRPRLAMCLSETTGLLGASKPYVEAQEDAGAALEAMRSLALIADMRSRPERVAVRDPRLADELRSRLADARIEVDTTEALPLVDDAYRHMVRSMADPLDRLTFLRGKGVDIDRARAYADAAAAFHRAAPWNRLTDLDLICVDSACPDPRMRWFSVLGAAGQMCGIGFYGTREEHARAASGELDARTMNAPRWLMSFEPIFRMPITDAELWEDHGFPLAGERAYPVLFSHAGLGMGDPPGASRITHVEGLLRTLAATTVDELDQGRWSKTVMTHDGEQVVELSMPAREQKRRAHRR
jgi:hypothetical protein